MWRQFFDRNEAWLAAGVVMVGVAALAAMRVRRTHIGEGRKQALRRIGTRLGAGLGPLVLAMAAMAAPGTVLERSIVLPLLVGGAAMCTWALIGRRPRGRECAGCGYDMGGTPGLVCPECGRGEGAGRRPRRRRWRTLAFELALCLAGISLLGVFVLRAKPLPQRLPDVVLIGMLPWDTSEEPLGRELVSRALRGPILVSKPEEEPGWLGQWGIHRLHRLAAHGRAYTRKAALCALRSQGLERHLDPAAIRPWLNDSNTDIQRLAVMCIGAAAHAPEPAVREQMRAELAEAVSHPSPLIARSAITELGMLAKRSGGGTLPPAVESVWASPADPETRQTILIWLASFEPDDRWHRLAASALEGNAEERFFGLLALQIRFPLAESTRRLCLSAVHDASPRVRAEALRHLLRHYPGEAGLADLAEKMTQNANTDDEVFAAILVLEAVLNSELPMPARVAQFRSAVGSPHEGLFWCAVREGRQFGSHAADVLPVLEEKRRALLAQLDGPSNPRRRRDAVSLLSEVIEALGGTPAPP